MRVLFCAVSGYGHVNPLLPLADAFVAQGDEVTFATPSDMAAHLAARGHRVIPCGPTGDDRKRLVSALPPSEHPVGIRFAYEVLFPRVHAPRMVPDLVTAVDAFRPDLMVCESAELTTPLVATRRGVRWVHHSYGLLRPDFAWQAATRSMAPLWAEYGLSVPPRAGMFDCEYVDVCPAALQIDEIASVPRRRPVRLVEAGPSMGGAGRPHVLVSFGTVFHRHAPLDRIVREIGALSVEATVTTGPDPKPIKHAPKNVRVVDYLPLGEVLPACDAVVTHGGSGTMLASLAHAVPLVVLPQGADNTLNAERVADAGAGIVIHDPSELPDALDHVLSEPSFREHARAIADQMRAMPPAAEVARDLSAPLP